jgi:hypothetical protein
VIHAALPFANNISATIAATGTIGAALGDQSTGVMDNVTTFLANNAVGMAALVGAGIILRKAPSLVKRFFK